jgi:hypothetical protein
MAGVAGYNEYEQEVTTEDGFVYRVKRRAELPIQAQEPKRVVDKPKPTRTVEGSSRRKQRLPKIRSTGLRVSGDIAGNPIEARQEAFVQHITSQAEALIDTQFADFSIEAAALHRLVRMFNENAIQVCSRHQAKLQAHAGELAKMTQEFDRLKASDEILDQCFKFNFENLAIVAETAKVEALLQQSLAKVKALEVAAPSLAATDPAPLTFNFPLELEIEEALTRLSVRTRDANLRTIAEIEACFKLKKEKERVERAAMLMLFEPRSGLRSGDFRDLITLKGLH